MTPPAPPVPPIACAKGHRSVYLPLGQHTAGIVRYDDDSVTVRFHTAPFGLDLLAWLTLGDAVALRDALTAIIDLPRRPAAAPEELAA